MAKFTLTQEHIELISNLNFKIGVRTEYNDTYLPMIDRKRPFGNSCVTGSVLDILGKHCDEETGEYKPEDIEIAETLLIELPVALEVVVQNHTFVPGTYEVAGCSTYCNYKHIKNYHALKSTLQEIEETVVKTDDDAKQMGRLHEICMNVSGDDPWKVIDDLDWFQPTEFLDKAIAVFEKNKQRKKAC